MPGNYDLQKTFFTIKGDILGGIVASIVALPQALAFGVVTGMGANAGLWGAIILCFFAGIFGTKLPMISGPTGPVAIVTATIIAAYGNNITSVIPVFLIAAIFQMINKLTTDIKISVLFPFMKSTFLYQPYYKARSAAFATS